MNITDKSVLELREILQKDYDKTLTDTEARKLGRWILKFYSHLAPKQEK